MAGRGDELSEIRPDLVSEVDLSSSEFLSTVLCWNLLKIWNVFSNPTCFHWEGRGQSAPLHGQTFAHFVIENKADWIPCGVWPWGAAIPREIRDSRLFDLRQPMLLCKTVEPGAVSDLRGHTVAVQTHLTSLRVSPAVLKKVFWFYSCRQNRLWKSLHVFICFKMNGIVERLHTTYHPSRLQSRESLTQSSYCVTSRSHLGSSSWVHTCTLHMLRGFIKSRWYFLIWNGNTTFSVTDMSDVPSRV